MAPEDSDSNWLQLILLRRKSKGALILGTLYRLSARLTPEVRSVWLVWALRSGLKRGTLVGHCWRRLASAWYRCTYMSTGTERWHRCDCLWRIHLKFRQMTAYKARIKSGGKICILDGWYLRTFKTFYDEMKNMTVQYLKTQVALHRSSSSSVLRRS